MLEQAMNELQLWQLLWGWHSGERRTSEDTPALETEPGLVEALTRLASRPLHDRAAFAAFVPPLWAERSISLRRLAVRLLVGSRTPAALQIAIEALDDDDESLRAEGLAVLRAAAAHAPLRWSHALFHPRAEIRRAAIEDLPHPDTARLLPWLRADPEHHEHPAVLAQPPTLGLCFELSAAGQLPPEALARALGRASATELMAFIRGAPQRTPAQVSAWLQAGPEPLPAEEPHAEGAQIDVLDRWCTLWQAFPAYREAMLGALVDALQEQRGAADREPIKRRIAAATRRHHHAHPDADAMAMLAVACAPSLLSAGRWTVSAQKVGARLMHQAHRIRTKALPAHLPALLSAPVAKHEDGSLDLTVALNLVGWFGVCPLRNLGPLVVKPPLAHQIAATPACWPALVMLTSGAHDLKPLLESILAHDPAAGLQIVAPTLARCVALERRPELTNALIEALTPAQAREVLAQLEPARGYPHLPVPLVNGLLARIDAEDLPAAMSTMSAPVLERVWAGGTPEQLRTSAAALDPARLAEVVDHIALTLAGHMMFLGGGHLRALAQVVHEARHAADNPWSDERWALIEGWVEQNLAPGSSTAVRGAMEPARWVTHEGRGLVDILDAVLATEGRAERAQRMRDAAETIVGVLRSSTHGYIGNPLKRVDEWIKAKGAPEGEQPRSGVIPLLTLLDREPALAEPAAAITAALLQLPQAREVLLEHAALLEEMAPDLGPGARHHLRAWPGLGGIAVRDPEGRPWLRTTPESSDFDRGLHSESQDVVIEAIREAIVEGIDGQLRLLGALTDDPRPPAAGVIARSVARFSGAEALEHAEGLVEDADLPIWLRFRVGLGLAPAEVSHWFPRLCHLACEPLPLTGDQPLSWFSGNDWDALVALARLEQGGSPGLWGRLVAGARSLFTGTQPQEPDDAELRVAIALAGSAHPHAYRRAVPMLLAAPRTEEIEQVLDLAISGCREYPPSLQQALIQTLPADDPRMRPFHLESILGHQEPRAAMEALAPAVQHLVAPLVLDAAITLGVGDHERVLAVLQGVSPEVDVDGTWRRLMHHAPTGPVRTAAVEQVRRLPGRDDKLRQIADTFAWGIRTGRRLTGNVFDIRMTTRREDLGFTRAQEWTLHVSPGPILAEHSQGRNIVEGLILHELGHHIHHHSPKALGVWQEARKAGLGSLLNLVADEHLERNLRAEDADFGDRLKRLATYAFQQLSRDVHVAKVLTVCGLRAFHALSARRLEVAEADTDVRLRSGAVLSELDRTGHPLARFVRALRMGLGNRHGDPVLDQALALFRGNFRHLDMVGLYEVTRELARLYGAGGDPQGGSGSSGGGGGSGSGSSDEAGGASDLLDIFGGHETLPGDDAVERAGLRDSDVQGELRRIFEPPKPTEPNSRTVSRGAPVINVGSRADFRRITTIKPMTVDAAAHRSVAHAVRRPAQRLRQDFMRLGLTHKPQRARLAGRAFDRTRTLAVVIKRDPRMLVARQLEVATDLFLGVAIDCSGSMTGDRIDKARRFGVLLAESVRGMHNVDAHFVGFTDRVIFDAGNEKLCAVTSLQAGGGNNDAAGLAHLAGLARGSRRRSKLLIMISDGLPTECSTTALRTLVHELSTRHRMLCAQIAVTQIHEPCFDHYIEVLDEGMDVSVRRFGQIVVGLARKALAR